MESMTEAGELFRQTYFTLYNSINGTHLGTTPIVKWDGGVAPNGRKFTCKWPKYAEKLLASGLDIEDYLTFVMSHFDIQDPAYTLADSYIRKYLAECGTVARLRTRWDREDEALAREVHMEMLLGYSREDSFLYVLLGKHVHVSPLVRYCFGCRNGYGDRMGELELEAYQEYLKYRLAYNQCCSDRIPQKWRDVQK